MTSKDEKKLSWKDNLNKENRYFETNNGILYKGDCLDIMKKFPNKIFDAIIADIPYGTTKCKWDIVISFKDMWFNLKKVRKDKTPIVLFGVEPFSSLLRTSNIKEFKYDWIWNKKRVTAPFLAKIQPLRQHEIISVFYKKQCLYNPQKTKKSTSKSFSKKFFKNPLKSEVYGSKEDDKLFNRNDNKFGYPKTILNDIPVMTNMSKEKFLHPTYKPLALMEYLIKTYTNEGDLILDFTCGSGTTLLVCENLNRRWIGIEINEKYCEITKQRILKK